MSLKRNAAFAITVAVALMAARGLRRTCHAARITPPAQRNSTIEVLEPLNTQVLVRRSIETFPSEYMNNISIIQGVALGLLATRTFETLHAEHVTLEILLVVGEAMFLLMAIIITAYEYLWFLTVVRWTPTFRDTLVPFILGVAEIVPQFFLGDPVGWWVSAAFLMLVGSAAFLNTIDRLRLNLFGEYEKAYAEIRKVLWKLVGCCLALTGGAGGMAFRGHDRTSAGTDDRDLDSLILHDIPRIHQRTCARPCIQALAHQQAACAATSPNILTTADLEDV